MVIMNNLWFYFIKIIYVYVLKYFSIMAKLDNQFFWINVDCNSHFNLAKQVWSVGFIASQEPYKVEILFTTLLFHCWWGTFLKEYFLQDAYKNRMYGWGDILFSFYPTLKCPLCSSLMIWLYIETSLFSYNSSIFWLFECSLMHKSMCFYISYCEFFCSYFTLEFLHVAISTSIFNCLK